MADSGYSVRCLLRRTRSVWLGIVAARDRVRDHRVFGCVWYLIEATSGGLPNRAPSRLSS